MFTRRGLWCTDRLASSRRFESRRHTMDYDALIKKLGTFGLYQKRLLLIVFFPIIFNSFGAPVSNFILGEHLHRCKIPNLENDSYAVQGQYHEDLINSAIPMKVDGSYDECKIIVNGTLETCSEWVYDHSVFTRTVNSQFNLVCDKTYLHSLSVSAYFFGYVLATVTLCPLGDVLQRVVYITCDGLHYTSTTDQAFGFLLYSTSRICLANIIMPFSYNVYMFIVLRFLDGAAGLAYYQGAFIIGMELVGPSKRLFSGTLILEVYVFGEFLLVFFAYFIRDWRWLQLALGVPMISAVCYWWPQVLPESPRWLLSRGKNEEAVKILRRAAKTNKVHFEDLPSNFRLEEEDRGLMEIFREFFHSKKLLFRWIIIVLNWFVISSIYYGLTLNIGKLGGNLYINFTVAAVVEFLGNLLCLLIDKTGRKAMHLSMMFLTGAACLASAFPVLFGNESHNWIMIALSMVGKFGISGVYGEVFIYTGELFPTVVRSFVIAVCSFGGRIGSNTSPYMFRLADGKMKKALPLLIYGVVTIFVAFLSILLPETKKRKLLEQVEDVEHEEDLIVDSDSDNPKTAEGSEVSDCERVRLTDIND